MLKDRSRDKTVHRSLYASSIAGTGGTKGVADNVLLREKIAGKNIYIRSLRGDPEHPGK